MLALPGVTFIMILSKMPVVYLERKLHGKSLFTNSWLRLQIPNLGSIDQDTPHLLHPKLDMHTKLPNDSPLTPKESHTYEDID